VHKCLVIDHRTKKSTIVELNETARITGVDNLDITWALENEGLCETERYTITEILASGDCCEERCSERVQ
jgi:hypothetical protein